MTGFLDYTPAAWSKCEGRQDGISRRQEQMTPKNTLNAIATGYYPPAVLRPLARQNKGDKPEPLTQTGKIRRTG